MSKALFRLTSLNPCLASAKQRKLVSHGLAGRRRQVVAAVIKSVEVMREPQRHERTDNQATTKGLNHIYVIQRQHICFTIF